MAEVMTPKKRGPKRSTETAFLALVPKLEKALSEKRKIVELYEEHSALGISYSQFARYIERHITKKEGKPANRKTTSAAASATTTRADNHAPPLQQHEPRRAPPRELATFHYDPMDAYRDRTRKD